MANIRAVVSSILLVAFVVSSKFEISNCFLVKSKLSCLDCHHDFDFSGIKILLKCDGEKKPATATATEDGGFEAELHAAAAGAKCLAKLQGGPEQLYAHRHDMVSRIVVSESELNTFTTSNTLSFSLSCPKPRGDVAGDIIGSSKTIDLFPGMGGFGLPPTGMMLPFLPIIGIP